MQEMLARCGGGWPVGFVPEHALRAPQGMRRAARLRRQIVGQSIMNRRGFLFGAPALLAAPAIVWVGALMPISAAKWSVPVRIVWEIEWGKIALVRRQYAADVLLFNRFAELIAQANSLPPRRWFDLQGVQP